MPQFWPKTSEFVTVDKYKYPCLGAIMRSKRYGSKILKNRNELQPVQPFEGLVCLRYMSN